jgi:hypothetical protein
MRNPPLAATSHRGALTTSPLATLNRWCRMRACILKPGLWKVSAPSTPVSGHSQNMCLHTLAHLHCPRLWLTNHARGACTSAEQSSSCTTGVVCTAQHAAKARTCHDRKHLLQQLQVVGLVELRRKVGRLEGHANLQQQVEPRVRDVALRVPEGPVAKKCLRWVGHVMTQEHTGKMWSCCHYHACCRYTRKLKEQSCICIPATLD